MIDNRSSVKKSEAMASLSLFVLISSSIVKIASGESSMDIVQRTLPAYTIALNAERILNSSACNRELGVFRDAVDVRKLWALKVLDSSGAPKPGFVYGNNYWIGSRIQCFDTTNKNPFVLNREFMRNISKFRKAEDEFPPYKLNYFVAIFRHNGTMQYRNRFTNEDLVTLGLCLPASCTVDQLSDVLENIFRNRILVIGDLYVTDFKLENVKDLQNDGMGLINARMIIFVLVIVITLILMVAGTTYDVLVYQKYFKVKRVNGEIYDMNTSSGQKLITEIPEHQISPRIERPSIFREILKCFSIYTNTKVIFSTKIGADAIGPINGLRFIGMSWVIAIHMCYFSFDMIDNKSWLMRLSEEFMGQIIINGNITVDTFFVISGFLMAYLYFKPNLRNSPEAKSINYKAKIVEFFGGLLKRFIRLTPAYMTTIGIVEVTSVWYGKTSMFHTNERPQESCAKYWWRNLLYINNMFGLEDLCLSWSWYLSNDMQYYIIGTFIVILSSTHFYTAATILFGILFSSTLFSGYISYINGYVPTLDEMFLTAPIVYYSPWVRIGSYIVGIVTAYILVRLNNKLTIRRMYIVILWFVAIACNLIVFFGTWERRISVMSSAFYVALGRTTWAVGIAWLLIACCTNHGGIINTILSFRGWVPLSRLTYCAYLLNPLIIRSIYLHLESSMHLTVVMTVTMAVAIVVITYLCSYALSLMMETPYVLIVRLFTKPRTQHYLSTK